MLISASFQRASAKIAVTKLLKYSYEFERKSKPTPSLYTPAHLNGRITQELRTSLRVSLLNDGQMSGFRI